MPTLLVTSRMSPALAARVKASVRGRHRARAERATKRAWIRVARFGLPLLVAAVVVLVRHERAEERRAIEAARSALLESIRSRAATLAPQDLHAVERGEDWLARLAEGYEGDLVEPSLVGPGNVAATLARGAVYVRGPVAAFRSSATAADVALASPKDAFLVCLVDPPASRSEASVLAKVKVAYAGGERVAEETQTIARFGDAVAGLPFLGAPWGDRVRAAPDLDALAALRDTFAQAPIDRALRAAHADRLLFVLDEPGEPGGVTELDGERAHAVRVGLVDLRASKVLLRLRRSVDPSWIKVDQRPRYAAGLDACLLAYEVGNRLRGG